MQVPGYAARVKGILDGLSVEAFYHGRASRPRQATNRGRRLPLGLRAGYPIVEYLWLLRLCVSKPHEDTLSQWSTFRAQDARRQMLVQHLGSPLVFFLINTPNENQSFAKAPVKKTCASSGPRLPKGEQGNAWTKSSYSHKQGCTCTL